MTESERKTLESCYHLIGGLNYLLRESNESPEYITARSRALLDEHEARCRESMDNQVYVLVNAKPDYFKDRKQYLMDVELAEDREDIPIYNPIWIDDAHRALQFGSRPEAVNYTIQFGLRNWVPVVRV